jgi:hypothetical protein
MTWFRRTGQTWKLALSTLFTLACVTLPYCHFADVWMDLLVPFVGIAGFVWFWVSVRCPECGGRPVWFMASRMDVSAYDPAGMERCPMCRDTGDVRPVDPPLFSPYRRP